MLEELGGALFGPWGLTALALFGIDRLTDGSITRGVTRSVVKSGYFVADKSADLINEVAEETTGLIEEAKEETGSTNRGKKPSRVELSGKTRRSQQSEAIGGGSRKRSRTSKRRSRTVATGRASSRASSGRSSQSHSASRATSRPKTARAGGGARSSSASRRASSTSRSSKRSGRR